jgi:periplasmic divalent cation tolerance protein
MDTCIIIFCTTPSADISTKIAEECIKKRIAACCNIVPGITSVYEWQGKIEKSDEQLLIIKSTEENFKALENTINSLHTYEIPEIIAVKINNGNEPYLKWINQSIR